MATLTKKIWSILILACFMGGPSYAEISRETVEQAWDTMTGAGGFKRLDIHYEDKDTPNAWILFNSANNYSLHVTTGLLKILEEEDDIAGILGHEIGHVRLGHYGDSLLRTIGYVALSLVLANQDDDLVTEGGMLGMSLVESGFSRGQEVAADNYGTDLLVRAGYNPYGLYNAMVCLYNNNYITEPSGFNSHPPSVRRIRHIHEYAAKLINKSH